MKVEGQIIMNSDPKITYGWVLSIVVELQVLEEGKEQMWDICRGLNP